MAAQRQADKPCPDCGSMYRDGDACNKCGSQAPVPESFYDPDLFTREGRAPRGRIWDSKKHKYVR